MQLGFQASLEGLWQDPLALGRDLDQVLLPQLSHFCKRCLSVWHTYFIWVIELTAEGQGLVLFGGRDLVPQPSLPHSGSEKLVPWPLYWHLHQQQRKKIWHQKQRKRSRKQRLQDCCHWSDDSSHHHHWRKSWLSDDLIETEVLVSAGCLEPGKKKSDFNFPEFSRREICCEPSFSSVLPLP